VTCLRDSFYVDNLATSLDSEEALISFKRDSCVVMAPGDFELRCWERTGKETEEGKVSVLGLDWNSLEDVLSVSLRWCESLVMGIIFKRVVLSVAQRVFDPVGFTCPATLYDKLLLQRAWKRKTDRDSELEPDLRESFLAWMRGLPCLGEVKIPRWMGGGVRCSLHMFCDASADAYAAVVFLRAESTEGALK
jgi:hypothetical protein